MSSSTTWSTRASSRIVFKATEKPCSKTKKITQHICGGLTENDPKRIDTIRRRGLVGVAMALLEEVCHCGGRL